MKVYVVTVNAWNGEHDTVSVTHIFANEKDASEYVRVLNSKNTSSYSPVYDYEEMDVIQDSIV